MAPDGREWIGDIGSKLAQLQQWNSKSVTLKAFHQFSDIVHTVPYVSARISRSQFSYTFKVNPGQKYIRLHFYPASYPGFERSKSFFTVKAGPYTLLSNFSASFTADALGLKSFVKEFCLNMGENQALTITLFPHPNSPSGSAYAFINGIEIVSMPTGLYYTQSSVPGSLVVGRTYRFHIENSTALEVVQRLNVGGSSILPSQDSGMFREWSADSNILIESGVLPIIDLGFGYLIRLHFCELEYGIREIGQKKFCILINKQMAEAYADLIEWSGGNGVAVFPHTHLVNLIGYCDEFQEMILVYEYMAHGTLADHIYKFRRNGKGSSSLTWEHKLNICIGAARGLNYLRTDPEYFTSRRLTMKSDVYAFGVVLFEVLCGRTAVDMGLEEEQHSLALWAQHCISAGMIHHIIDPELRTQISPSCLKVFVEIAKKCLCNYSKDWPNMGDVVGSLELALATQASSGSYKEEGAIGVGGADNKKIDGTMQLGGADLQPVECPVFEQDQTPLSNKRAELTITKADQSMALAAKDKDVKRKKVKVKDNGPDGGLPQMEDLYYRFSLAEIQAATNNFDENLVLEAHRFIDTYKGYIFGSVVVVIRKFKPKSDWERGYCWANIEILTKLHHVHLLSPIGLCTDEGEMILLYNYMENGSIGDHLFGMDSDPLPWKKRLEICIGAARGLQYLHSGSGQTIIHCNIHPNKILLDHDWVPKVSYLMVSKALVPSSMASSPGYLDPEYVCAGQMTEKSDVYSLGVVLLNVLSGGKANWHAQEFYGRDLKGLFKSCIKGGCIDRIIDPYLMGKIAPECLREFVKIIWSCLLDQGIKRPSMDDVVERLQFALKLLETLGDHIQFGSEAEGAATEISFKAAVIQAYNDALFNGGGFITTDTGGMSFSTAASCHSEMSYGMRFPSGSYDFEMSCVRLDDSDYYSSNLAR
ncbi:malectin/receptor-like protein kinase family protein [Actinidia rufa]|uniref:Malectin/receptor-like protein kinase family protein n=1 Tax=Actinidia rufa TaxID=165716 RepID=A0A7J0H7X8_9ERIC|nr:malectin/receptor-like protein kinase family protein [Actinidia rufa]